jgi:hypothetical protein
VTLRLEGLAKLLPQGLVVDPDEHGQHAPTLTRARFAVDWRAAPWCLSRE